MVTLATEHMMTISTALVSIIATNWGAKNYANINAAYDYSMKLSTAVGLIALVIFLIFAPK